MYVFYAPLACLVPTEARREYKIFGTESTDNCEPLCVCWELRGDLWIVKFNKLKKIAQD